jgi:hypothetical protein
VDVLAKFHFRRWIIEWFIIINSALLRMNHPVDVMKK